MSSSSSSLEASPCNSNASYLDEDMAVITDWDDDDNGNGVSDQVTFDSKECMRFDTNTAAVSNAAWRTRDIGSFASDRLVLEMSIYFDTLGTRANDDHFEIRVDKSSVRLTAAFASDGLFIYDGVSSSEVGSGLVVQDEWQKWVFDCDMEFPSSATCEVYLNNVLVGTGIDCSHVLGGTDGRTQLIQHGETTNDQTTYIDYIKIGNSCIVVGSSSSSESTSVSSSSSSESASESSSSSSESVSSSSSSESMSESSSSSSESNSVSTSLSSSSESSESISSSSVSTSFSSSSSESVSISSSSVSTSESSSSSESTSFSSSSESSESISQSSSSESSGSVSVSSSSESSESVSVSESSSSSSEDYAFYATVMPIEITPHSPVVFGSHQASAMSLTISAKTVTFPLYGRMGQPIITGSKPKVICEGAKAYIDFGARNAKILMSGY